MCLTNLLGRRHCSPPQLLLGNMNISPWEAKPVLFLTCLYTSKNFITLSSAPLPNPLSKMFGFFLVKSKINNSFSQMTHISRDLRFCSLNLLSVFRHNNAKLCALCLLPQERYHQLCVFLGEKQQTSIGALQILRQVCLYFHSYQIWILPDHREYKPGAG